MARRMESLSSRELGLDRKSNKKEVELNGSTGMSVGVGSDGMHLWERLNERSV